MESKLRIGLPLLGLGFFLGILGCLLFFDRLLLTLSNLSTIVGFYFLLGTRKFRTFFFNSKKKKGSCLYFAGVAAITVFKLCFVGIILQLAGLYFLFGAFIPNIISYIRVTPLAFILELPLISHVTKILQNKNSLPV